MGKCQKEGCEIKTALYNYTSENKGLYCSKHCKESMVDVVHKKCEHDKYKYNCKSCKGVGICSHNKRKNRCIQCKGSGVCEHNKLKSTCVSCHGSAICEHNKRKDICRACKGSSICEHDKRKSICKICKGSGLCLHQKEKSQCKNCNGVSICEHKRRKIYCKQCNGSYICLHGIQKTQCKQCKGSSICEHDKLKTRCKQCDGSALCKSPWCETQAIKKYDGHCFTCYVHLFPDRPNARNYKTKERTIVDYVKTAFPDFTWVADRKVADGCSARRPDLLLDLGYQVIVLEVDENQHEVYDCSCENKRLMEISRDVGHRPLIFLRFNPDGYTDGENEKVKSCWSVSKQGLCHVNPREKKRWEARLETLKGQITYWSAEENKSEKTLEVVHLYYDGFKDI